MDGKELAARLDDLHDQINKICEWHGRQPFQKQREQLKMSEPATYIDPTTGHMTAPTTASACGPG